MNDAPVPVRSPIAWRVLRTVLGLLLLTAAVLKLSQRHFTPIPELGWFATPIIQIAVAEWEIILACWLLSGSAPAESSLAALFTFAAFGTASLYLALQGQANCGCFGEVKTSPWTAVAVDAIITCALVIMRTQRPLQWTSLRAVQFPTALAIMLTVITATGATVYGTPDAALRRLRGDEILIVPSTLDFREGRAGDGRQASLDVYNYSSQPVRIVGGTSDCSCVLTEDIPATIGPGEKHTVSVRFRFPDHTSGFLMRKAWLMTDDDRQRFVELALMARVVPDH
jgi:hypothetical protein